MKSKLKSLPVRQKHKLEVFLWAILSKDQGRDDNISNEM